MKRETILVILMALFLIILFLVEIASEAVAVLPVALQGEVKLSNVTDPHSGLPYELART